MNRAETGSRRGEAGRAAAMNSAEQTVTWLITLGVLESPKKTISDPEGFLQASLKDGVVLCRLLERLLPGTIEKVSAPRPAPPRRTGPGAGRPGGRSPGGGSPGRWEASRPTWPPPRPGMRGDARAQGRRRRHLVAARAGRAPGAAEPTRLLCARTRERGPRGGRAGGARTRWRDPARGAIVCGGRRGGGRAGFKGNGRGEARREGERSALPRPEEESPLSATRAENQPLQRRAQLPRRLCLNSFCWWYRVRVSPSV